MPSVAADPRAVDVDDVFHNLIPSRFPPVSVYERIAGGRDELFYKIEEMTNPRAREKERLTRGLAPVDQDHPRLRNWNHAPFVYPNPEGSRFFGADRNLVELAGDLQTALAIAVEKRETFLGRTKEAATYIEMRQIVRPVRGSCLDVRGLDIAARETRIQIGKQALAAGLDGILFNPVERPTATAVAVFKPECLGKPDQAEHFKFIWNGNRITVLYRFKEDLIYEPDGLGLEETILAA